MDSPEVIRKVGRIRLPTDWVEKTQSDEGYCYLTVLHPRAVQKAAYTLGPYPRWREVKNFGCFASGSYHFCRVNGLVHISSQGAGVRPQNMFIKDNDVVGGTSCVRYWLAKARLLLAWLPVMIGMSCLSILFHLLGGTMELLIVDDLIIYPIIATWIIKLTGNSFKKHLCGYRAHTATPPEPDEKQVSESVVRVRVRHTFKLNISLIRMLEDRRKAIACVVRKGFIAYSLTLVEIEVKQLNKYLFLRN